jgi:selenocysteine-specific elongation factor
VRNIIIGVAGHIDHGKTTLVKALTGIDTDRHKEEKERHISIDIGFAHCQLPSGRVADFVDVPGHERFVRNMLRGVGGIDIAILVIAADDGVMPQTIEHLAILDLLGVSGGLIVLTKADLVEAELINVVEEEAKRLTKKTFLAEADVIPFAPDNKEAINKIKESIDKLATKVPAKDRDKVFRLPIDQVYVVPGYGTVVTGTVASGSISLNSEVEVLPDGLYSRVRLIQSHRENIDRAIAGQRVGLCLTGVKVREIRRGMVVAEKNLLRPVRVINACLSYLPFNEKILRQADKVKFYLGTSEVVARVFLIGKERINPGESSYVQFRLEKPVVAMPYDRFIIRSLSPITTLGGGVVLQVNAPKYKRNPAKIMAELSCLENGQPEDVIETVTKNAHFEVVSVEFLSQTSGLSRKQAFELAEKLVQEKKLVRVANRWYTHWFNLDRLSKSLLDCLWEFHNKHPLKKWMSKEELKKKIKADLNDNFFELALAKLVSERKVIVEKASVRVREVQMKLSGEQKVIADKILKLCSPERLKPLSRSLWEQAMSNHKPDQVKQVLNYLASEGKIILLSDLGFLHPLAFRKAQEKIANYIKINGKIRLAEARDLLGIGRKATQSLLEYFDKISFTTRFGEFRVFHEETRRNYLKKLVSR